MRELSLRDGMKVLTAIIRHNDQMAKDKRSAQEYMVPFFRSEPGTGKSAMVHGAAYETGRKAKTLILAQYDPADLGGFVYRDPKDNEMRKARPSWMPKEGDNTVVFLDEFSQSPQSIQNVAAQLVYDRHIGEHHISSLSTIVVAGNRQEDRAGTQPLVRHFLNRVTSMAVKIPVDDWVQWAAGENVHPAVIGFIAWQKTEALHKFNPQAEQNPTARSWYNVSNAVKLDLPRHLENALVAGYVGDAAATTFAGFRKVVDELPDPEDIIRAPLKAPVPTDPQIVYATVTALAGHAEPKTVEPIITYLDRLERKEFTVFAIRYLHNKDKKLADHKSIVQWMAKNAKLFV